MDSAEPCLQRLRNDHDVNAKTDSSILAAVFLTLKIYTAQAEPNYFPSDLQTKFHCIKAVAQFSCLLLSASQNQPGDSSRALDTHLEGNLHPDGIPCFYNQEAFHRVIDQ